MTRFSLEPAFVEIFSHSTFGPHVMTLPTLDYNPGGDTFDVHSGTPVDATDMITNLVDKLLPFFPDSDSYIFDNFRIFTLDDPDGVPLLRKAGSFTSKEGTNSAPGWFKAVQRTVSALDADGFKCRLTLLDAATGNSFDQETTITPSSSLEALFNEWSDDANGWASRQGARPATFLEVATTLNEKLRRAYRMF